ELNLSARRRRAANYCAARRGIFRARSMTEAAMLVEFARGFVEVGRGDLLHLNGARKENVILQVNALMQVGLERGQGLTECLIDDTALPVFDDKSYPSTVAAEEETVVLYLDKNDVKSLCLKHPQIAMAALKTLAGRLRKCAELVEALSLREVD